MSWTEEYREIVEFYFWEPQHIGRAASGKRFLNADEMYAHVNDLEVSLNHILNLFFSLYSINKLDCFDADAPHTMLSAWQLEQYAREQKNATQPDLFFVGDTSNVAIELKTKSKSTLSQVLKYAAFNAAICHDNIKPLRLYFIAPSKEFGYLFREKFESETDLYGSLAQPELNKLSISVLSYNELYHSLILINTKNETEERLIGGLVAYLEKRAEQLKITIH